MGMDMRSIGYGYRFPPKGGEPMNRSPIDRDLSVPGTDRNQWEPIGTDWRTRLHDADAFGMAAPSLRGVFVLRQRSGKRLSTRKAWGHVWSTIGREVGEDAEKRAGVGLTAEPGVPWLSNERGNRHGVDARA
jgi:hypothetical protein